MEIGAAVVPGWNDRPAGPEITGTQTFSASGRKARCTHRGMRRWSGWNLFGGIGGVALEENRYRDIKGVISGILQFIQTGVYGPLHASRR